MTDNNESPAERLRQRIGFVMEMEKLKAVLRQSPVLHADRRENDAEHSWHIALMAWVLEDYAGPGVSIARVMKMLLIHDVVEIDAGDTFLYDEAAAHDQAAREAKAADRLFGLLPASQAQEFLTMWHEFEARETADAKFAKALDRLQPNLINYHAGGGTWLRPEVHAGKAFACRYYFEDVVPELWTYLEALLNDAVASGMLRTAPVA